MNFNETLYVNDDSPLKGTLSISKVFPDGRNIEIYNQTNLILSAAKLYVLSSLYLPAIASDPITQLAFGTGGCIDPAGLFPKQELATQTGLNTFLTQVPIVYTVNTPAILVTFVGDLDQTQGNGLLITEAGLVKASTNYFNVKNFPGIPKTSEFSLHIQWTIQLA